MSPRGFPVLVVEDEETTRELLIEILAARGHDVDARPDGESAWTAYRHERYPLVLIDLRLPGMDGLELTRKIRELPEADETVILFVTAVEKRDALEAALDAGADDYVEKPVNQELLHVRLAIAERTVRDLRERKETEARLVRDALHDPLTGLANRNFLEKRVGHSAERSEREKGYLYSVLVVDLDGFTGINERHGEEAGAELLRAVADRLADCVRSVDAVARLRTDEFGLLLDGMNDISDPSRVAARVHESLAAPFRVDGRTVTATACIGIALSATGYENPEEVLNDAYKALGRAKDQGAGSTQMFDPVLHARAMARIELESRIRRATEKRQMVLRYQPVIRVSTGRIEGFEALVRWDDEKRGLVAPSEFIPVAEETGLIVKLGWILLEDALGQLAAWLPELPDDHPLFVSVNLSPKQFGQPDAQDRIRRHLDAARLPGERLHVEISETSLMSHADSAGRTLSRLKESRIRIQVDDFGTGYSSLSNLCRFPIDTLKIDRSFINHMLDSRENLEVVRTIVRLARNLEMTVVAEGVETEGQLEQLRELGCDLAQGYLFSRPVDAERAVRMLDDRRLVNPGA